jgi:hypothetical protein
VSTAEAAFDQAGKPTCTGHQIKQESRGFQADGKAVKIMTHLIGYTLAFFMGTT